MRDFEVQDVLRREIRKELIWYRDYWGIVRSTDDRLTIGRILVEVPDLQLKFWCSPRYAGGVSVPKNGAVVQIGFVEGNPKRPFYYGRVPEQGETLKNYSGPLSRVVVEDPNTGAGMVFDGTTQQLQTSDGAGQTLESDIVTDPVFWTALTTVCGIFGLTVTKQKAVWGKGV